LPRYIPVATQWKLPSLSSKHGLRLAAGVVIVIAAATLLVGQAVIHPKVTRQQAIQAAMKWGDRPPYPRVEAKYMRSSDLAAGMGDVTLRSDNSFVWVVAVSGRYALSPLGRTTWGIAIIRDEWGAAQTSVFEGGVTGNWPPFFDDLPDRAKS
jgi:hypothetical protein